MKTSRNLWPLGILLTFVVFFAGMATVVTIAVTHRESLVSENYYEQELKYQDQLDSVGRAQKSGAAITCDRARGAVIISLPGTQLAQPLSGTVEFYRPSSPALDHQVPLKPQADGTQTLSVSRLASGLWRVRVHWNAGGQNYFLEQKIVL